MTTDQAPTIHTALVSEVLDTLSTVPPADRIQTIGWLRAQLDGEQLAAVEELREAGASWADVGAALGTSREAAWQRYGTA